MRDEEEANEAIAAGADIVMLDNFEGGELRSVARRLRERWSGSGKKFLLETSGGITDSNLHQRAISGSWISTLFSQALNLITSRDRYPEHELCASEREARRF